MKCQTSQEYFKATELLMDREKPWSNETTMKNDNKYVYILSYIWIIYNIFIYSNFYFNLII